MLIYVIFIYHTWVHHIHIKPTHRDTRKHTPAHTYTHIHTYTNRYRNIYTQRQRDKRAREPDGQMDTHTQIDIYLEGMAQVKKTHIEVLCFCNPMEH